MEIKHGRFAMAATAHVFLTTAGVRWPGYLSFAEDIKFSDMPGGTIASWAALPDLAWLQIILIVAVFDNSILAQDPSKAPGDVAPGFWVRYDDVPGFSGKEWKLNAERNNGRAAMMGILGMLIHEGLTGNPVWPIPVPPQPVLELAGDDIEKGPARASARIKQNTPRRLRAFRSCLLNPFGCAAIFLCRRRLLRAGLARHDLRRCHRRDQRVRQARAVDLAIAESAQQPPPPAALGMCAR